MCLLSVLRLKQDKQQDKSSLAEAILTDKEAKKYIIAAGNHEMLHNLYK
jgi:hypothetical protein